MSADTGDKRPATGRRWRPVVGGLLVGLTAVVAAQGQSIANLQTGQPITIQDAVPLAFRAFSGAADYQYEYRRDNVNFGGVGLALDWGIWRGVEVGASTRLITHPHRNAKRGIGAGDLDLHALLALVDESGNAPAAALRADIELPTGFASRGTDLAATALVTKSFETFRAHGNFAWTVVGQPSEEQRQNVWRLALGADWNVRGPWRTDSLLLADVVIRQSVRRQGRTAVVVEVGARRRIGIQTLLLLSAGTEIAGEADRQKFRFSIGGVHAF